MAQLFNSDRNISLRLEVLNNLLDGGMYVGTI